MEEYMLQEMNVSEMQGVNGGQLPREPKPVTVSVCYNVPVKVGGTGANAAVCVSASSNSTVSGSANVSVSASGGAGVGVEAGAYVSATSPTRDQVNDAARSANRGFCNYVLQNNKQLRSLICN
jgi:hypothetical protein